MRVAILALLGTVLGSCGDSGATVPPPRLEGTWGRSCTETALGYEQTRITFDPSQYAIRTSLYADELCTELQANGAPATLGSYIEVGRDDSGFAVQWNTRTNEPEDPSHVDLIPRAFDVYAIQGDQLYYGDYSTGEGTSPAERPLNLGLPLVAVRVVRESDDAL